MQPRSTLFHGLTRLPPCLHTPVLPVGRTFLRKQPDHSVQLYSVAVGRWSALTKHIAAAFHSRDPTPLSLPPVVAMLSVPPPSVPRVVCSIQLPCPFFVFPIEKTDQLFDPKLHPLFVPPPTSTTGSVLFVPPCLKIQFTLWDTHV